jgi:hypothetical protein
VDFKQFLTEQEKPWKAKRANVLRHWGNLRPNMPLQVEPISNMHKGPRYHRDGIRITGSAPFISSVMSRIKDMLAYDEAEGTKLDIDYKQAESGDPLEAPKFVCYIHVLEKEPKKDQLGI